MITIQGLSSKQKVLMDVMWSMDSLAEVQQFIKTLPKKDQQDCASLIHIAALETEEYEQGLDEYESIAVDVISRVSSR